MREFLATIILTLGYTAAVGQADLEVTIKRIREVRGSVRIGLFDKDTDFPEKAVVGKVIDVTADSLTVVFKGLKAGYYAISVIHDENNNEKLDMSIFRIPNEGFAFGNNAMGTFGPPSFRKARVVVRGDTVKQVLFLKYF